MRTSCTWVTPRAFRMSHRFRAGQLVGFSGVPLFQKSHCRDPGNIAIIDLRHTSKTAGGEGSYRLYLGHGPGNSAAVELFLQIGNRWTIAARCRRRRTACRLRSLTARLF